ncbi:MAG TPA: hypothetical protein VJV78_23385 [Polyangiales bacterium]|nr:hypothetical protein [Polyangiales bacterium]
MKNGSKALRSVSSFMPCPVSLTVKRTLFRPARPTESCSFPPFGIASRPFTARFSNTCCS